MANVVLAGFVALRPLVRRVWSNARYSGFVSVNSLRYLCPLTRKGFKQLYEIQAALYLFCN